MTRKEIVLREALGITSRQQDHIDKLFRQLELRKAGEVPIEQLQEETAGEEVQNGVYARYTPDTHELVGFTITGFSRKFGADLTEIAIPASG